MIVRPAMPSDLGFVEQFSPLPEALLMRKLRWLEVLVALEGPGPNSSRVGWLGLDFLWSRVPCVAQLHVTAAERRDYVARALLDYARSFLRSRGYELMPSSSNIGVTDSANWHRRMGFADCGAVAGIGPTGDRVSFYLMQLVPGRPRAAAPDACCALTNS